MITEDYVSFEIAKLLKEKEFDEACHAYYHEDDGKLIESYSAYAIKNMSNPCFFGNGAPTLQMVMKWLREKSIFITLNIISFNLNDSPVWSFDIWHNNNHEYRSSDYFDSYEQACDAAIKYCLENLI